MVQFSLKDVYFSYSPKISSDDDWVLKGINLQIREGEFVIILGHNGCGKTTLLKHLNGLLKPQRGDVFWYNKRVWEYRDVEIFSKIGFLFQNPDDQIFGLTVEQDVSFGPINLGLPEEEVERRVVNSLKMVGILELRKRRIDELSFGQKQRVAIAGVLANEPSVIVFDEPTSYLDPATQIDVMNILKELNSRGITVIITTHDIEYISEYSNRILVMIKGRIVYDDTPKNLFTDEDIIHQSNLRLPLISILFRKICKKYNLDCNDIPTTVDEGLMFIDKLLSNRSSLLSQSDNF